ncbi:MAG TPA: DUF5916 domain-containing protein, partial [Bacteroidota bacterium]|nr:DUF5916 domain-containing protein [Bacteroidota bacterium]
MKQLPILSLLLMSWAAADAGDIDTTLKRPTIEAIRSSNPIAIDGILSELEWQRTAITQFTQRDPNEGAAPTQNTDVWVAYDDAALYIAARMHDTQPDSIVRQIGRRDADLSADWFYVGIDAYHDRRSGFFFGVYASGTMSDGTLYNDDWDDNSWDGVWDVATKIDDKGWVAEMRIPYSQLRFPKQDQYTWGINFVRQIERNKERDDFVLVPKKESGWVSRFADLTGLRDINPPRKLEILPYVVTGGEFLQHDERDPFHTGSSFTRNVGADVKFGLGSNLTLNGTINPDFGQVEVDPAIVNLSQYETFFDEKRPFFVEGSNFFDFGSGGANSNWGFNFGNPNYFYSRRIGRPPQGSPQRSDDDGQGDVFYDVPGRTHIIGAGKLTGKLADGWSIATLQAMTSREHAATDSAGIRFEDVVQPYTFYGVARSQLEFNSGRQAIGLIGTAVMRDLGEEYLVDQFNRRSFAVGVDGWTNLDSAQVWVTTGWLSTTRIEGSADRMLSVQQNPLHNFQRPDAGHLGIKPDATSLSGYGGRIALNKQKGNTYLNAAFGFITPEFDSNDLGFLFRTDVLNAHLVLGYRWFEPDGLFRRKNFNLAAFRGFDFDGNKTGEGYFLFYNAQLMNYWDIGGNLFFNPVVLDPYKTRGGPLMQSTNAYAMDIFGSTDSRQPIVLDLEFSSGRSESGGWRVTWSPGVSWKPTSGINLRFSPDFNRDITIAQWVNNYDDVSAAQTFGTRYIFGKIDQDEVSAVIRLDWTFTP